MIAELVIVLLVVGALGCAGYWKRNRMERVKIHEEQLKMLKLLKIKFERAK